MNRFPVENIDKVNSSKETDKLATARNIKLTGDVTGSASFNGTAEASITATVADDSHNHVISNIDNLQSTLDSKGVKLTVSGKTVKLLDANDNELSSITTQDTNTTYSAATASALGLVKIGSNITVSSGTISLTKSNVTAALGYTPPTTNTTYSTGNASTAGLTKLYTSTGSSTDGTMTRAAITSALSSVKAATISNVQAGHISDSSGTITLPSGGRWAYFISRSDGTTNVLYAGIATGGTNVSTTTGNDFAYLFIRVE